MDLDIEDQQLAGQGQDTPSKPTLVKSSLGWPLLFAKPSAKALPGQNLRVGGVSVEKPWGRPKGHSSRIWKTRNLELTWLGTSFDIPFSCVILLFAVSPDLSSLWKGPNLSQIFWFWKYVSKVGASSDILLTESNKRPALKSSPPSSLPLSHTPHSSPSPEHVCPLHSKTLCLLSLNTAQSTPLYLPLRSWALQ